MKKKVVEVEKVVREVFKKHGFTGSVTIYGDYIEKEKITKNTELSIAYPVINFPENLTGSIKAEDEIRKILDVDTCMSDTSFLVNDKERSKYPWLVGKIKEGYTFEIR